MIDPQINPVVLVNFSAGAGTCEKQWNRIESSVKKILPDNTLFVTHRIPFDTKRCLQKLIKENKVNCFISAGGDGSVNRILNELMDLNQGQANHWIIGGIGLGSSNDFLKPHASFIDGIPTRINFDGRKAADIGKVQFENEVGQIEYKYFIINSSIGITATANLLFNRGDSVLRILKSKSSSLSILYAALKTIFSFKNLPVTVHYNEERKDLRISNLSVIKNPHISGDFKYDQKIKPDDGLLGLNICIDMNKPELLRTLWELSKGKFSGSPKRLSDFTTSISVYFKNYTALEFDGEVSRSRSIHFSILPKHITLLST